MGGKYGSIIDFILCCSLSFYLSMPRKRTTILAGALLAGLCIGLGLFSLGWSIVTTAFLESLSAINQTVGGVVFAAAVLVVVLIWELVGRKKSEFVQKILQIVGAGVFAAIGVWLLIFMFKVFIGVPIDILREANGSPALVARLLPQVPRDWDAKTAYPPKVHKALHLSLRFIVPKTSHGPGFSVVNESDSIARDIRWGIVLWNSERPDQANTLPILLYPIAWIKGHEKTGFTAIFQSNNLPQLNAGDTLIGSASVDCPNCMPKSYVLYIKWGQGGWYGEAPKPWSGKPIMPADGASRTGREAYFKGVLDIIPQASRIPMPEK